MSLQWMDGFDLYSAVADVGLRPYSTFLFNSLVTGRFTGGQAYRNGTTLAPLAFPIGSGDTKSIGFAFRSADMSVASTGKAIMTFRGTGQTVDVCKLGVDVNGALIMGRADFTTNKICNSANGVIVANAWNYIEVELTRSATVGAVNVWVNGVSVASAGPSANTGAVAVDGIQFFADFYNTQKDIDDLYVTNVATKLGERRIDVLRPSADTAQKDFTPSTGVNNFANVDDTVLNADTDYNSASVVGNFDLYDVTDLSFSPVTVSAVQVVMSARKDDATTRAIRSKIKSGGTTTNGATIAMGTTYNISTDLYELNPTGAVAWTGTTVNGMQLGVEVVT